MTQLGTPETAERKVLAYFGHHKCASTWIGHILERVSSEIGLRLYVVSDWLNPSPTGPLSAAQRWNTTRLSASETAEFPRNELRDRVDAVATQVFERDDTRPGHVGRGNAGAPRGTEGRVTRAWVTARDGVL